MGLDEKTKSLIAVGASITANCQPCLKYHEAKARENGASDEEISAAIEVGNAVRAGSASHMDKFAAAFNKCGKTACSPQTANKCCC